MQIFINKNGNQLGPFPESKVAEMLKSGQLAATDLAWSEGLETWKPLSSFAQLQSIAGGPPPLPGQPPALPSQRKTEPLSIWALALGIGSIVGCWIGGFLAGLPAVICGHIGLSRIKRDPSLDGKGMALAGLITGYIGLLVIPLAILPALAIPAITQAMERAKATQTLSNMRSIHLVLQQAEVDGKSSGKFGSKAELEKILVENNYIAAADLKRLQFDKISVGNVSAEDPADTILLQAKSENGRSTITFLKGGDGRITRPGQPAFGRPPPRRPAFLE